MKTLMASLLFVVRDANGSCLRRRHCAQRQSVLESGLLWPGIGPTNGVANLLAQGLVKPLTGRDVTPGLNDGRPFYVLCWQSSKNSPPCFCLQRRLAGCFTSTAGTQCWPWQVFW